MGWHRRANRRKFELGVPVGAMNRAMTLAAIATGLCACANALPEQPGTCKAPHLLATGLMVGDGSLDRGFPGGISLVDFDGDGDIDIMATRGYDPTEQNRPFRFDRSMLYVNDGTGRFSHAPDNPLSNADNPTSGSTWADIDEDGDLDAFVSTQHGKVDVFYRNQGGGRMVRENLGDATSTPGSNFTSSWADMDGDSDLDLISGGATLEPGQPNLVFRNDRGTFKRVRGVAVENGASNPGAVIWADFDNDGDQDLFVANSDVARLSGIDPAALETSQLYRNDGAWRFARTEGQEFDSLNYPGQTAAIGDIDNDGDLDLFLGMQPGPSGRTLSDRIFLNDGRGQFKLNPGFEGPPHAEMAGGAAFADLDLDGDLDLVLGNFNTGLFAYVNDGTGRFTPIRDEALAGRVNSHSSLASGDLDGDGDLDFVVGNWGDTHEGEFATILTNASESCGTPPVRIVLRNRFGATDPPGARVTLITQGRHGRRLQMREASAQSGWRSQSASAFTFGVPAGESVVRVDVRWPDGRLQSNTKIRTGEVVQITEPSSRGAR